MILAVLSVSPSLFGLQETVDRIAAVVNEDVITLSDLQIVLSFGLYDDERVPGRSERQVILERLINQKLVIGLTMESIPVTEEELEVAFQSLVDNLSPAAVEARLDSFGLEKEDLQEYLYEKILYRKIIQERFGLATIVSLKEMEDYYRQRYVPSQESKGVDPKPMMELLDEIESAIKEEKIRRRVEEWLANLKREADIQILLKEESV